MPGLPLRPARRRHTIPARAGLQTTWLAPDPVKPLFRGRPKELFRLRRGSASCLRHPRGLWPLRAVLNLELDFLPLRKGLEAVLLDGGVVHEDILTTRALDEPVPLRIVEPLNNARDPHD
jgi:hypothetical protein